MPIEIRSSFAFHAKQPTDVLLQFEVADLPEQRVASGESTFGNPAHFARVAAHDDIGERIWMRVQGPVEIDYSAKVEPNRLVADIRGLSALAPHHLPSQAVQYLFDSRYCRADAFQQLAENEFAGTSGGERIAAISDWISEAFTYTPGASTAETDATESFIARRGICRDYAHVLIALARASTIPARYVACYAPGVDPQDFHALAEVFLADPSVENGGSWQLIDATSMADLEKTAKIGVGRDAADVSFLTSFGPIDFKSSRVEVS